MELRQDTRLVRLKTALEEPELFVTSADISEEISELTGAVLSAFSVDAPVRLDELLGKPLACTVETEKGVARHFHLIANEITYTGFDAVRDRHHYTISAVPWLWLFSQVRDSRLWQEKTTVEIVEELFSERGYTDFEFQVQPGEKREYCVQYRESTLSFVSRLFEEEGYFYFFRHEEDKHVLVVADTPTAHPPVGDGPLRYRRLEQGGDEAGVSGWVETAALRPGKVVLKDYDFKKPDDPLEEEDSTEAGPPERANLEIFDYPGRYTEAERGSAFAAIRMARHQGLAKRGNLQSNAIGPAAGMRMTLADHPTADGDYVIVGMTHRATNNFDGEGGAGYSSTLEVQPIDAPFRPIPSTPRPVVDGPQTAFVVGREGEEIDTDEYGRVHVQFHWDRRSPANEESSCWIRVAQSWAGDRFGGYIVPRVGMEVLVDFLEGDPDRPLVTGVVTNEKAKPPYPLPDNKTRSVFRTNSSPDGDGFNELSFEDAKGEEQVFLRAENSLDILVNGSRKESIGGDRHARISKNDHLLVEEDQSIIVKGDTKHRMESEFYVDVKHSEMHKTGSDFGVDSDGFIFHRSRTAIVLKCGRSAIQISGDKIIIESPMVYVNSGQGLHSWADRFAGPEEAQGPNDPNGGQTQEPPEARRLPPPSSNPAMAKQMEAVRGAAASGKPLVETCQDG